MDFSAMFRLSYGLFVLGAKGERDNACIVNTVIQVTDNPKRIALAVNKSNLTNEMISKSGEFNVSVLSEDAPFSVFERFGFSSGRTHDKFAGYENIARSENGLLFLTEYANAYISGKIISASDLGTHTLFTADVTDAKVLSDKRSMTYQYYFDRVKPKPVTKKKGFVCRICGYVYEGEELPPDFVCPICGHGADDFEPIEL